MKPTLKTLSTIFLIFILNNQIWAGNNCNTATSISNDMSSFETFSNTGNSNSGVPAPPCGNYTSSDFWFSTTVPPSGFLSVVLLPGTMVDPAIAIYTGSCNNLNLEGCSAEDFCGNESSAIYEGSGLVPGTTYFIRVWAVGGAPNGTFEIRVSSANPPTPSPLTLNTLVGTASNSAGGCIQLTNTINNQLGCAWDSNQDDMTQIFEKNVVLNFGTNNGGADGITLAFQNSPAGTSACGIGGGGIGANSIPNSLFFEFDTWDNGPGVGDIPQDHAAVFINGDNTNIIAGPVALNGGNIETGEDFPIKIKWNGVTFDYEVYFDDILVLSGNYDISTNSLGGGTMAHWGTTASTGGANNNQSICPYEPEPYFGGTEQIVDVTICEGQSHFAGGANQTTTGVYTDNVPLANGCQSLTTTNLTVIPTATETLNEVVCEGTCITIGANNTFCTTGTFNVTLQGQSALGCDSIVTLNLQVLDPFAFIIQNPIPTIDCTNTTVFLDGSFSSTGPDITYEWSGPCIVSGWGTPIIEAGCDGNYTLVVTQTVGNAPPCTSFNTITVVDNQVTIIADAGPNQVLDCTTGCVFLNGTNSSSGNTVEYLWSGPNSFSSTELNPEVCEAGTYTLLVFDTSNDCFASDMVTVSGSSAPTADAGADAIIDCNNTTATLNGSNSTTGNNFTLTWLDATGATVGAGTTFTTSDEGTYTLVVSNNTTGCSSTDDATVLGNNNLPNANAGPNAIITCTNDPVLLDGSGSESGNNITLTWLDDTGATVGTGTSFLTSDEGTYTLVVTNTDNNCTSTDDVIVIENTDPPFVNAGPDTIIDCNNPTVTLNGNNSNSGIGYDLVWETPNGDQVGAGTMLTTSQPGTYILVVTDTNNGCSAIDIAIVVDDLVDPIANAGADAIIDCNNTSATLDGGNSNTGIGFELTWLDDMGISVGGGNTFTTTNTGTYTLVVTNTNNGCSSTDMASISGSNDVPNADAGIDMAIDCNNTSATLDGSNSDNGIGFTLVWENAIGDQVGMGNTLTTMTDGTYTLIVTNTANGCSSTDMAIISGNSIVPNADAGIDMVIDCNNTSATLDGSNSDNGIGFTLVWENAIGDQVGMGNTLTTMTDGIYTLVVTNTTNGCSSSDNANVTINNTPPNADAGMDVALSCSSPTATLDGSNSDNGIGFTLVWENANGDQVGMGNTLTTSDIGIYTLIVTNDATGCSESDDVVVTGSSNLPTADAGQDAILNCNISQTILNGSNSSSGTDFSYQWQNSNQDSLGNEVLLTVTNEGTYTFIVTDNSNGCTQSDFVIITFDTLAPIADAGAGGIISCTPTAITLDGSNSSTGNDFTYEWFNSNNTNVGAGITLDIASADTFTLVVTNEINGCTASDEVIIQQDTSVPAVFANSNGDLTCTNLQVILDGTGSDTGNDIEYEWLDDIGSSLGDELTLTTSISGIYTLVVTNTSTSCSASTNVVVQENTATPTIDILFPDTITCTNLQVTLDGSNSSTGSTFEYNWLDSDLVTIDNEPVTSVSNAGFYTLVITDMENGCTVAETVEVIQEGAVPIANISLATDSLDCNNEEIILSYSGPIGNNITYQWMIGNTLLLENQDLTVDAIGIYNLVVTNTDNGCFTDASVEISENFNVPEIETVAGTITCIQPNVALNGAGSSNGPNFSYEWQNNLGDSLSNNISLITNQSGNYTFIVTDISNGCSIEEQVIVDLDITNVISDAGQNATITCGNNATTLDGINSTSGGDINYQWTNTSGVSLGNEITLDVNTADTFILIVTNDTNGCADTSSVEVFQDANLPTIDISSSGFLTCADTVINLSGINSIGTGTLSYSWTDANGNFISNEDNIDVTDIGNYNLVVTDMANGCSANETVLAEENITLPVSDAGMDAALSCTVTSATLNGINSSIGPGITYEWISPNGTTAGFAPILSTSESGTFTLVVTDIMNGCSAESTANVISSASQPNATILPPQVITCTQSQITLIGSMSSGSGTLSYQWYNSIGQPIGTVPNLTVSQSGIYILDVIDNPSGCVASTSVMVESDITPPIANTNVAGVLTCAQNSYTIDASNSSMGSGFDYEWQDENGNSLNNNFSYNATTIGTYNLIVTNISNGCTAENSIIVTEDLSTPNPIAIPQGILTCQNEIVTIDASSSTGSNGSTVTFEWFDPSGNTLSTQDVVDVNEAGQYEVILTNDINGCSALQNVVVQQDTISPQPSIEAITNLSLDCNQNSLVVDGSNSLPLGNVTYEWLINNNTISTIANPQIDEAGDLVLTITDNQNGCTASTSVTITQNEEAPNITIANPETLTCFTTTTELDASSSSTGNDFTYEWTGPGTILNETTLNPIINQAGTYILTITNSSNGCTVDANISVAEDVTPPLININPADEFNCTTFSITLDASNSSTGNNFTTQWTTANGNIDNNANTLNPNISLPGIYTLEITNTLNGCITSENITVIESSAIISSADIVISNPLCFGDNGNILIEDVNGGTPPYLYSIDFQPFTTNSSFNFLDAGNYNIIVEDSEGCQYSEEITITNVSELILELPKREVIKLGESYNIQPQINFSLAEIDTFIWTPSDSLTCTDCPNPTANPLNSTLYELTIISTNGCIATDNILIVVEKPREVFIPNVFTPNGDGINDIFQIFANDNMVKQVNKFQIFTRWGELVFTDENFQPNLPEHGWNGFFNGKKINPSVLVYYAEIEFIDGFVEVFKGDVTLK